MRQEPVTPLLFKNPIQDQTDRPLGSGLLYMSNNNMNRNNLLDLSNNNTNSLLDLRKKEVKK